MHSLRDQSALIRAAAAIRHLAVQEEIITATQGSSWEFIRVNIFCECLCGYAVNSASEESLKAALWLVKSHFIPTRRVTRSPSNNTSIRLLS